MMRIELYVDRNDRLTLDIYPSIKNENIMQQLKGRECYEFIKELCSSNINEITQSPNKEDIIIKSNDFIFTVNEFDKVFQKNGTKVIRDTINDYNTKQKLNQMKPKKVTRKNKHTCLKVIAGLLTSAILTAVAITSLEAKQKESIDEPTSYYSQVVETDSNDLVLTDGYLELAQNYYSKHDGTLLFSRGEIVDRDEFLENRHALISEEEKNATKEEEQTEFSPDTTFVSLDYQDRSGTEKAQITRAYYTDAIKKYADMYGVDYELMLAIATQERGVHSETRDSGGAIGLFQIENIWNNEELTAYNYETKEYETITVDENRLSDVFYNIKVGCMVFQTALRYMDYNIPAAIQCYNMGCGNMEKILTACSFDTGKTMEEILSDPTNLDWLKYRHVVDQGDKNYVENVSSYLNPNTEININHGDEEININIKRK